jgi:hypothetical protein
MFSGPKPPSANDAVSQMTKAVTDYQNRITTQELSIASPYRRIVAMYKSLSVTTTLDSQFLFWSSLKWSQTGFNAWTDSNADEALQSRMLNSGTALAFTLRANLQQLYEAAQSSAELTRAADALLANAIGVHMADTPLSVIARDPALNSDDLVNGLLKEYQTGTVAINLDDFIKHSAGRIDELHTKIDLGTTKLDEITKAQPQLSDYDPNSPEGQKLRQTVQQYADDATATADSVSASLFVAGSLISVFNPNTGGRIEAAAVGASGVVYGLVNYATAAVNLGLEVFGVGTELATGDFVGAIGSLFGFFSGGGPTPAEAQMLNGINQLKSQIAALQTHMDQRFDQIDAELKKIYDTMNDRFDDLEKNYQKIAGLVEAERTQLITITAGINRLETQLSIYFADLFYATLQVAIDNLDSQIVTQQNLSDDETALHLWATKYFMSNEAAGLPADQRSFADADLLSQISNTGAFERNINFLNDYPAKRLNLSPISPTRVGNYRDWITATQAYFHFIKRAQDLNIPNPVNPQRLNEMRQAGLQLRNQMSAFASPASSRAAKAHPYRGAPDPTNPVFTGIFPKYQAVADSFYKATGAVATDLLSSQIVNGGLVYDKSTDAATFDYRLAKDRDDVAKHLEPWGGDKQITTPDNQGQYVFLTRGLHSCSQSSRPDLLSIPAYWAALDPSVYRAGAFGVGAIDLCFNSHYVPFPYGSRGQCTPQKCVGISMELIGTYAAKDGTPMTLTRHHWVFYVYGHAASLGPADDDVYILWSRVKKNFYGIADEIDGTLKEAAYAVARSNETDQLKGVHQVVIAHLFADSPPAESGQLAIDATNARQFLDEMTAFRRLLQAYAVVGLPTLTMRNDLIHATLFGNSGIPDRDVALMKFGGAKLPFRFDPTADLSLQGSRQIDVLHTQLQKVFTRQPYIEGQELLTSTIEQIEMLLPASELKRMRPERSSKPRGTAK